MDRGPRAKELADLKESLANFVHQLDACEARVGYQSDVPQAHSCLASADPQIAFANEVVAAMKNRMTEDHAMFGMRQGDLS